MSTIVQTIQALRAQIQAKGLLANHIYLSGFQIEALEEELDMPDHASLATICGLNIHEKDLPFGVLIISEQELPPEQKQTTEKLIDPLSRLTPEIQREIAKNFLLFSRALPHNSDPKVVIPSAVTFLAIAVASFRDHTGADVSKIVKDMLDESLAYEMQSGG